MKKTEIGVIPEDWEVVKIEDICDVDSDNLTSTTDLNYEIKYISLEYVDAGRLLGFNEVKFRDAPSRARRKLKFDDILVSTVRPNLKSHYLFKKIENNFIASTGFAVLRTNQHSGYIYNHFFANTINRQIENLIVGSNYPAINSSDVKSLQIPLPPLPEQEAIAAALSDADAWIDSLEQLIAKKRLIKQGAMQTLLTPHEDWEVKKLGEVCDEGYQGINTAADKIKYQERGIPILQAKHITKGYIDFEGAKNISKEDFINYKDKYMPIKGEILFTNIGTIGKTVLVDDEVNFLIAWNIFKIKLKDNFSAKFLLQIFKDFDEKGVYDKMLTGNATKFINRPQLFNLNIAFPSLSEQERIATILSDMDAEIEALEQKLAKAKQIKQGMMQELLTGRVRLV
ncbi:restriction endonuclease subunit S [Empedobacter falsenii]